MRYEQNGYKSGHPWYYLLGGRRLSLKQIRDEVRDSGYQGWMAEDIFAADRRPEPQRSETLRAMRTRVLCELRGDLRVYRECARELAARRRAGEDDQPQRVCADIHTNISLKHNHLYNDLAHLDVIDDLLSRQLDLFAA